MWKYTTSYRFLRAACQVGQATTEYAIATSIAVLASYAVLQTFGRWLAYYAYDVTALLCLPIP